jgi:predicted esterase
MGRDVDRHSQIVFCLTTPRAFQRDVLPRLSGKPILVLAGARDSLVPREETERLAGLLKRAGADVTLNWADATHGITGEEVRMGKEWLAAKFTD